MFFCPSAAAGKLPDIDLMLIYYIRKAVFCNSLILVKDMEIRQFIYVNFEFAVFFIGMMNFGVCKNAVPAIH